MEFESEPARRRFALQLLSVGTLSAAASAASAASAAPPARTSTRLSIEAPDDVFVITIANNGTVKAQQTLAVLSSPTLERLSSRFVALQAHLEIAMRPFNDGRVDRQVQGTKEKLEVYKAGKKAAEEIVTSDRAKFKLGTGGGPYDLPVAEMQLASATSIYSDAILAAEQIDSQVKDAKDRLALAKDQLDREQAFLTRMTERMTITSPKAGIFTARVMAGLFVRKGHQLGELQGVVT